MSENYMILLENSMNPSSQLNGGAHQSNQFQHPMNNEVHQLFLLNSIQPQNPSDLSHLNQQLPPQHSIQHPIQHSGPHQHHLSTSNPSQPPHLSTSSAPNSATVNLHSLSINPNSNPTSTANSASTPTGPNVNSGFVLRISNIPNDLTYREATIIFSLVIDHILKIELNSKESYILAFFNNFNTCVTTYKLLNQKCIFGNDTTPINVEIDESLSFEFNNLSLRNNGSMSAPASAISIHPSANGTISTILPSGKPQTSNVPPTSSGTIGSSSNRSRFSFNDPFHEFDPSHPHEQANSGAVTQNQPQGNQGQSGLGPLESNNSEINTWSTTNPLNSQASSQPQTPVNNLNFDWNQSSSASLASKNSSNRRTSSAFFQSNFSNNLLSNQFMNSNLNQPLLNQQTMPMVLNQPLVGQQQGQHGQNQQSQTGQQPQNQHSQGQSQGQNQGQSQGQNQGQNQSQPSSNPVSNPPSQNGLISNASQQPSNNNLSMPTPTTSQLVQVPNISPPSGTSQLLAQQPSQSQAQPQTQPQPSQTQQSQSAQQQSQGQGQTSSNITSPVQQGTTNAGKKDVPDLSLLARVPPPANPADQNPPCNTLYVGNLPPDATEQELRALFSPQKGFRRLLFRTKTNNNPGSSNHGPMCFVEFEDVAHATRALAELYGRILPRSSSSNGKGGIRLSFSKNPLGVRGPQRRSSSNQVNNGFNYNYHMKPN